MTTNYNLVEETAKIYAQRERLFGSLVDVFVGKNPLKPITSLLSYAKRNSIKPKSLELMTFDLKNSIEYLKKHHDLIKDLDITLIGSGDVKNGLYKDDDFQVTIKQTNKTLTEHINIINTDDGKSFIWHEPLHIVDDKGDYFGYEDGEESDEENMASERLRARLYKPTQKQLEDITKKIDMMLVKDAD